MVADARRRARSLALAVLFALAVHGCFHWAPEGSDVPACASLGCRACANHTRCAWCAASRACVDEASAASACPAGAHTEPSRCAPDENVAPSFDAGPDAAGGESGALETAPSDS